MYMHVALTLFSIILCLEQRGGGMHVHACGVVRFQLSCVWNSREEVCMYMNVA